MNCRFESVKMGLLPGNRAQRNRLRRVHGLGRGGAGLCARLKTIQAGMEAGPTDPWPGLIEARTAGEGGPYPRS